MAQRKPAGRPAKIIWRISESFPQGEIVDPAAPRRPVPPAERKPEQKAEPEFSTSGWVVSSFELLNGTVVSEDIDTVPDDLFDELFPGRATPNSVND